MGGVIRRLEVLLSNHRAGRREFDLDDHIVKIPIAIAANVFKAKNDFVAIPHFAKAVIQPVGIHRNSTFVVMRHMERSVAIAGAKQDFFTAFLINAIERQVLVAQDVANLAICVAQNEGAIVKQRLIAVARIAIRQDEKAELVI